MKKLVPAIALVLLTVAAYAADENDGSMQNGMMQGDMMKNCQEHMKDSEMMDSMPKDMMAKCQEMMKSGMMQDKETKDSSAKQEAPAGVSEEEHKKHHPAQ